MRYAHIEQSKVSRKATDLINKMNQAASEGSIVIKEV